MRNNYNNYKEYGIYNYTTPMDAREPPCKAMSPKPGFEEEVIMKEIPYRELIGTLLWASNGTRPDISYAVSTLAKYTTNPGILQWKALLRVLGYLYATQEYCIKYARNGSVVDGINARGYSRRVSPITTMDGL